MKDLSKTALYLIAAGIILIVAAIFVQTRFVRSVYDYTEPEVIEEPEPEPKKKAGRPRKQEPEPEPEVIEEPEPEPEPEKDNFVRPVFDGNE